MGSNGNREDYRGPERRVRHELTLEDVEAHIEHHIQRQISAWLENHAAAERRDMEGLKNELVKLQHLIVSAFPDGDTEGHRRYHEESIETMRDLRDMLKRVRNSTVTGVVWALLAFVGLAVWSAIKSKVGAP